MRAIARCIAAILLALIPLAAAAAQSVAARDTVVLTSGKQLRGRVLRADENTVILRVGSRDRSFSREKVRSVTSVAAKHRSLMTAWQDTPADDVGRLLELATAAENSGLVHEARLLRWYALLQRPGDAAIHELLGNKKRGKKFHVEIDGKWVPFAKADALGEDFDDAWRLRSEHFEIQCAAGLRMALDTLMELEQLYWIFHEVFGEELGLLEIVEPMSVRLYRERRQMPGQGSNVGAYFSVSDLALFTVVERGRPFALVHEGTHLLLHFFFVRATKSRGTLPAWLDEGWAEYMEGRVRTPGKGKASLGPASNIAVHRRTLLQATRDKKLYGVHRLLNLKAGDFMASSKQQVKYAQAWALFRFLYEHRDAALRAQFLDYLRAATTGKGQASTFRRIFKKQQKRLETEPWQ
ncbi:MAG: DUF1570 domain-containing protein [bacterium]|nr:DUF1570 domain-containing protein [bacterium]